MTSALARGARAVVAAAAMALPLAALPLAGCGGLARQTARAWSAPPDGLPAGEQRLRDALATRRWADALALAAAPGRGGPDDPLLRDLYAGAAAYYAGRWDESAAALERAAALADDRFTKSASRGALALLTNDLALPYVPGQNERLFVHYYGLLGRLRRGDAQGAAVEARRIGFLLQQYEARGRDALDAPTRAVLRYVSGAAFEAAGEREDAAVAYRNAAVLLGGTSTLGDPSARDGSFGDVVVVVEQGFVAHRVGEILSVRVGSERGWELLTTAGDGERGTEPLLARAAVLLADDRALWAGQLPRELRLDETVAADGDASGSAPAAARREALRVAWPAYRRVPLPALGDGPTAVAAPRDAAAATAAASAAFTAPRGPSAGALGVAPTSVAPAAAPLLAVADVSEAVVADFRRDRAKRLARLLVRAAARATAAAEVGRKHRELADLVTGVGRALERADTRSWHLLPGRIAVARLRLPAGRHDIAIDVGGAPYALGSVEVPAGGIAVATGRVY